MVLCCLRHVLKPSTSAPVPYRSCTSTSGCTNTPMACKIPCVRFTCLVRSSFLLELRHRCNTRYGWVAHPYPTGTSTPQDVPDLSRRDNNEFTGSGTRSGGTSGYTVSIFYPLATAAYSTATTTTQKAIPIQRLMSEKSTNRIGDSFV